MVALNDFSLWVEEGAEAAVVLGELLFLGRGALGLWLIEENGNLVSWANFAREVELWAGGEGEFEFPDNVVGEVRFMLEDDFQFIAFFCVDGVLEGEEGAAGAALVLVAEHGPARIRIAVEDFLGGVVWLFEGGFSLSEVDWLSFV